MKRLFCVIGMIYVVLFFAGFVDAQQSTVDHAIIVTDSDPQSLKIARVVAEQYWNAQKISDEKSFQEVTPQSLMKVVFDWSFVKQSDIRIEQGPISKIKDDLSACIDIETKVDALPKSAYSQKATLLKKVSEHARKIESQGNRMLGDSLKRGYWSTIIPKSTLEAKEYKLMYNDVIVNVDLQSKAGTSLKKRIITSLRRFVADSYDSGWKVFFASGM